MRRLARRLAGPPEIAGDIGRLAGAAAVVEPQHSNAMGLMIEIDVPHLLPQLVDRLEAGGCSAEPVNSHACRVDHRGALDADEALTELRFFARAWAEAHGGVTVTLQPER